jgi:NAD(P)-dependent dehydrogenase (short-subunit alcohol dehydrogenase family)
VQSDESTIESAASHCASSFPKATHHLHLAFAIPGILYPEKSPSQINYDDALLTYKINTLGPLMLMKHFHEFLPAKSSALPNEGNGEEWRGLTPSRAVFAMMSARVGSISDNKLGGWYSYRSSKSAVNQIVKTYDNFLRNSAGDNAMAVALHPGTVKTELSKEFWGSVKKEKLFDADFSAECLVKLCTGGIGLDGRGKCWDWNGKEVPS